MTQPVNSASSQTTVQNNNTNQVNQNQTTSVKNTSTDTISSANNNAQTESTGFFGSCSGWISNAIKSIRACLANLPLIGWIFADAVESPVFGPNNIDRTEATANYVKAIKDLFAQRSFDANGNLNRVSQEDIAIALEKFKSIPKNDKIALMDAFVSVYYSLQTTQAIMLDFYKALPESMQNALKHQVWLERNNGSTVVDGEDRWINYGDYMMHHKFRLIPMDQAVNNYNEIVRRPPNMGVVMGSDNQNRS